MPIDFLDPAILGSYASSLFAILLALYNLYKAREAAKLSVSPVVEIGTLQIGTPKLLYFPLLFTNDGARAAHLGWIELYLEDVTTKKQYPFYITKNVMGRKFNEIKSILPLFPISIQGHSSQNVVLEFSEGKNNKVPLDKELRAVFTFRYNDEKTYSSSMLFELKSSFFSAGTQLKWNQVKQRIKDPSDYPGITLFGGDMS